jgi:excisionase family DNA binding protein
MMERRTDMDTVTATPPGGISSPWMTREEAAEYLRVSPFTLDRWVRQGRLQRHRIDGLRSARFRQSELDALVVPENG